MNAVQLEKARTQMRRGVLELCILSIIGEAGEAYPPDIKDRLGECGITIVEGTLYPLLTRLKNSELLGYTWRESNMGPPRKYYTLTEKGQVFQNALLSTWQELVHAVSYTTKNHQENE